MFYRAIAVWLLIGGGEVLQGILRIKLLNRRVGDHRARQIGVVIGSGYILAVAWASVGWIGVRAIGDGVGVGLLWLALMLALDLGFGRFVFHAPWSRIAADFDLRRGGWLGLGMLVLATAPLLAAWARGLLGSLS